ncbi:hypothetical protein V2J09_006273 [Rumex salicifolius]
MASGKKESEAFNMLKFMYQDDDDELEDTERGEEEGGLGEQEPHEQKLQFGGESGLRNIEPQESNRTDAVFPVELQDSTPVQQWDASTLSSRWERPTIVDYGHDEVAMSPEAEEGEIVANARFMHNQDADIANDDLQDRAFALDVVIISTPTDHLTPLLVQIENSESDAWNNASKESEMDDLTGANIPENVDPLDRFLPTPPNAKCPVDLQKGEKNTLLKENIAKAVRGSRKYIRVAALEAHSITYAAGNEGTLENSNRGRERYWLPHNRGRPHWRDGPDQEGQNYRYYANQIDFPKFEGGDPRGWFLKAEINFQYFEVPKEMKVKVAVMHLEGDALDLYAWVNGEEEILILEELMRVFQESYGPPEFGNPDEFLCSIRQTGTVALGLKRRKAHRSPGSLGRKSRFRDSVAEYRLEFAR